MVTALRKPSSHLTGKARDADVMLFPALAFVLVLLVFCQGSACAFTFCEYWRSLLHLLYIYIYIQFAFSHPVTAGEVCCIYFARIYSLLLALVQV